jgi:DNA-binding beta-propeller fold protein YncE
MRIIKFVTIGLLIAGATSFSGCNKEDEAKDKDEDNPHNSDLIGSWNITSDGNVIPWGIAVDGNGNVYISELMGNRIGKYASTGTLITTWGTFGINNGQFSWPKYIAVDGDNNIYVADEKNLRIQKFNSAGLYVTKWEVDFAGTIAVDKLNKWVYTVDVSNVLQKFDLSGNFMMQWGGTGTGDGQLMLSNQNDLSNQGMNGQMAVDKAGNIYVVDNMNFRIQKFSSTGAYIMKWGSKGSGEGQFLFPCGIAIDSANGFVYVADNSTQNGGAGNIARIEKFDLMGKFIKQWIVTDDSDKSQVMALAVDKDGNVLSIRGSRVFKYAFKGIGS